MPVPPASPSMSTLVLYVLFAALSTAANLLAQELVVRLGAMLPLATHRHELRKVSLYGAFSVVTTLVFWLFEVSFWMLWRTDFAKYSGAVLGLAIGYAVKYFLDRRFVFAGSRA
jgi:hypothetical protein